MVPDLCVCLCFFFFNFFSLICKFCFLLICLFGREEGDLELDRWEHGEYLGGDGGETMIRKYFMNFQ